MDGKPYVIGFEMRLPVQWNGRFFHKLGEAPDSTALMDGFAVLSSDAGHTPDTSYPNDPNTGLVIQTVVFSLAPQARRDLGSRTLQCISHH